jgi:predicted metal-dependent hydrolase
LDGPGVVWLDGRPVPVEYEPCRRAVAELRDGRLLVGGDEHDARRAIVRWYRREARRRIAATFAREKERLGLDYASLSIRDQRTRWASCSRKGNLSFSWRLALAPEEVRNYVVVHELCHLRELNHSKRFYRLLDEVRPGWRGQSAWLRDFGQELLDYRIA